MYIGYIYLITNLINNKKYVGQKKSSTVIESYYGSGKGIKNAIAYYGQENFKREILCWCETKEDLCIKEQEFILKYNCLSPNGYNMTLNTFNSGLKQCHSQETKDKIRNTRLNTSEEKKRNIYTKFKKTIDNRSEEEKQQLSLKISNAVKNSEKFNQVIHSDDYRLKQSISTKERFKNLEERNKLSEKSKENWKQTEYYDICIKNLKHDDSQIQRKRGLIGSIKTKTSFNKYNTSEQGKEKSKEMTKHMQNIIKNMTEDEKELVYIKGYFKRLLKTKGLNDIKTQLILNKILEKDPTFDIYDSSKDRFLNKKFPIIKLVKKDIVELDQEVPVYDLTVNGDIPNFQTASQVYVHNCPGAGKSKTMAFLTKQAITSGKRVIFITLELNQAETMANIESAVTGFRFFELLRPENLQAYKEKHMQFINKYGDDLFIKFYKPATVTCDTIHNYIQKVIQYKKEKFGIDWKPDVIFLDYLDKLLPIQKVKGNLYEDIGGVVDDCKNLAISFHCPVISGSQLGRNVWNIKGAEVMSLDSLADSSRKAHLAHSITTINTNPGEKSAGKARLFMAKSRSGRPGTTIYIEQDLGRCNMYEVEPWDPATLQGTTTYTVKSVSGS